MVTGNDKFTTFKKEGGMLTWTVAFRTGGTLNCEWKKTVAFLLKADALDAKETIEKGGRKALLFDTDQLNAVGLPVGWDADDKGWEWEVA